MGVSPRNLWDMKPFYERYYQADLKLQQAVAVLPWKARIIPPEVEKEEVLACLEYTTPQVAALYVHKTAKRKKKKMWLSNHK